MGLFETIVLSMFDTVMMLFLVHNIMKNFKTNVWDKLFYIIATSILIAICSIYVDNDVYSHLMSTLTIYSFLFYYFWKNEQKNVATNILVFLVVSLFLLILQLSGIVVLNVIIGDVEYTFINGLLAQSISLIVLLLLIRFVSFSTIYVFIENKNITFRIIVLLLFTIYYGVSIMWFIDINHVNEAIIGMGIIILLALTINTVVLREGLLSRSYIEKIRIYDTYLPIIDNIVDELRSRQHDYHNHIQTIISLKKSDLVSDHEIGIYVDELFNKNIWNELLKLENKIIVAFLYSKFIEAMNREIDMSFLINNFTLTTIYEDSMFIEMYGILIDNAIEAAITMKQKNIVAIKLFKENDMNVLEVRNSSEFISVNEINKFFKKGYTTKDKRLRGVGLYKLKNLVEKKKGTISIHYDTSAGQVVARIDHF